VVATVDHLLAGTSLAGSPVLEASGVTGAGLDAVREAVIALRDEVRAPGRPPTLAIDRVFTVRGRGVVVTGTLRGGPLSRSTTLRLVPGPRTVRVREVQVHGATVERVDGGGRAAVNLVGVDAADAHRGRVLTSDPAVIVTDRILAAFRGPVADRARGRIHVGTAAVDGAIGRSGRDALALPDGRAAGIVRLAEAVALRPGDRFVLRRGARTEPVGGVVLDTRPPRGISRRRQTVDRVAALAAGDPDARLALHGLVDGRIAPDVMAATEDAVVGAVGDAATVAAARTAAGRALRRLVTVRGEEAGDAAAAVVDRAIASGRLVRDGDTVRSPDAAPVVEDPALTAAMARLEAALRVLAPPPLADAARQAGCPPDGIRELERSGRIVILAPDLAYAMTTYRDLTARALSMAAHQPLTPAAFRDATGTSRKYVMAILEDLDRRAMLRRTPEGHVPGPKAPAAAGR
jgi:selenocysteine-specific elongation factor